MLPHDWLTSRLGAATPATDRGDASGTGYFGTPSGGWLHDVVVAALGHDADLPRVASPAEVVGETARGALLAVGTGDNIAAALGLGLWPGEIAVSIGTSGTVFAVSDEPAADPAGAVAGFADATGRFLPLVCTPNAGLALAATAIMTGTDLAGLAERAFAAEPGASGITLLPYFDGERTPDRPGATGVMSGLTTLNATPENLARAAVEGVLGSLADAADLLARYGVGFRRALLIGGGARSSPIRKLARAFSVVTSTCRNQPSRSVLGAGAISSYSWWVEDDRRRDAPQLRQQRLERTGYGAGITQFGGDRRNTGCVPPGQHNGLPRAPTGRSRPAPRCRRSCLRLNIGAVPNVVQQRDLGLLPPEPLGRDRAGGWVVHADERARKLNRLLACPGVAASRLGRRRAG